MGNYRFRLSDMMPNAWFYKLRDMSKARSASHHTTKKKLPSPNQNPRKSFHQTSEHKLFSSPKNPKASDTHFPHDPPRKSSKKLKTKRKTIYKPSPKQVTPSSYPVWVKPEPVQIRDWFESPVHISTSEHEDDFLDNQSLYSESDSFDNNHIISHHEGLSYSWSSSCSCKLSSSTNDIIIDMDKTTKIENFNMISERELPPIRTTPKKDNIPEELPNSKNSSIQENSFSQPKNLRTMRITSPSSRKSVSRPGKVKIKGNWQKFSSKKSETRARKSVTGERKGMFYSQSFAIVKASLDPEQDFRDSMMEMIVENNIRASKDLEELLACYLSLNSNQYHDLIIKAFEEIWFNMPEPRL